MLSISVVTTIVMALPVLLPRTSESSAVRSWAAITIRSP